MKTISSRSLRACSSIATRAFTLLELIVVILIIGVLLGIAVPSFSAMLRSSESSMADTLLRNALRAGRDVALRSGGREDVAVVFTFDARGRLSILTCVKVGELADSPPTLPIVLREIFVPVDISQPTQLPKYWTVRGYAQQNAVDDTWYERGTGPVRYGANPRTGDWVFPETDFYNKAVLNEGFNRHSFMIRFEAGTGLVSAANGKAVLVFLPSADLKARSQGSWANYAPRLSNHRRYVESILVDNRLPMNDVVRRSMLGDLSADTVLVKPVKALALLNERRLADALGLRLDNTTDSLYTLGAQQAPRFAAGVTSQDIGNYIEGNGDIDGDGTIDSRQPGYLRNDVKIFLVDRFTSELREVEVQP